jgi:hypothetical protein
MNNTSKLEQLTESLLLKEFGDVNLVGEDPGELKNAIYGMRLASAALAKLGMKKIADQLNQVIVQLTTMNPEKSGEPQAPGSSGQIA